MRTAKEQAFFEQGVMMGCLISERDFIMRKQMTPTSNPGSVQARIDRTLQAKDKSDRDYVIVKYHALSGQVFTTQGQWYEMQELFNECSRQAYENHTSVDYVVVS